MLVKFQIDRSRFACVFIYKVLYMCAKIFYDEASEMKEIRLESQNVFISIRIGR